MAENTKNQTGTDIPETKKQKNPTQIFHLVAFHPRRNNIEPLKIPINTELSSRHFERKGVVPITQAELEIIQHAELPTYSEEVQNGVMRKKFEGYTPRFTFDMIAEDVSKGAYEKIRRRCMKKDAKPLTREEALKIVHEAA